MALMTTEPQGTQKDQTSHPLTLADISLAALSLPRQPLHPERALSQTRTQLLRLTFVSCSTLPGGDARTMLAGFFSILLDEKLWMTDRQ